MKNATVGFAMTGSFCNFELALGAMKELRESGFAVLPIMSFAACRDSRFGRAEDWKSRIRLLCGEEIIDTVEKAEPIGPKNLCDLMAVAPCTGNTLAKLACGITDTPVTMAVKSHLRAGKPVLVALCSNDALAASARNLGELLNRRSYYFAPLRQDDCVGKPTSLVTDWTQFVPAAEAALEGRQYRPLFL